MLISTQRSSKSELFSGQKVYISEEFESQYEEIKEFLINNGCIISDTPKSKDVIHLVKKFDGVKYPLICHSFLLKKINLQFPGKMF